MNLLLGCGSESVFPARYDRTRYTALRRIFVRWQTMEILPQFRGAASSGFDCPLQRLYLRYEGRANRTDRVDLAAHYLVGAAK